MASKPEPWQIAARLEDAANAIAEAARALDAVYSALLCISPEAAYEVEDIPGAEHVTRDMARALQTLSDRYQAAADAEQPA
jgi:methionyl-tRNA synthetase